MFKKTYSYNADDQIITNNDDDAFGDDLDKETEGEEDEDEDLEEEEDEEEDLE